MALDDDAPVADDWEAALADEGDEEVGEAEEEDEEVGEDEDTIVEDEQEKKAKEEAARKAKEESARKAKEEAARKAQEEEKSKQLAAQKKAASPSEKICVLQFVVFWDMSIPVKPNCWTKSVKLTFKEVKLVVLHNKLVQHTSQLMLLNKRPLSWPNTKSKHLMFLVC